MTIGLGLGITASGFVVPAAVGRTAKAITAYGNAQVDTAVSKFGGASALFDGTGDYLQIPSDDAWDVGTAQTVWTIEGWLYVSALPNAYKGIMGSSTQSTNNGWGFFITSANKLQFIPNAITGSRTTTNAITASTWQHFAVVRNGTSFKMFIDGVQEYTTASYGNYTDVNEVLTIGRAANISSGWNGYLDLPGSLDEIRISNTARYTANFTAPTAPFVNDADTVLLIHADGTDGSTVFTDDNGVRSKNGISAIGNAQVDTAVSKFGGASGLFDGTGDYLVVKHSDDFNFGSNDFTIEGWVYPHNTSNFPSIMGMSTSGTTEGFSLQFDSGRRLYIEFRNAADTGATTIANTGVMTLNTWTHFAFTRSGTSVRSFRNGTLVQTVTINYALKDTTADLLIGDGFGIATTFTAASEFDGNLDEIRISNVARYTATFTAPTAPFVNDADTILLVHMDGTNGSTTFTDDNS